jgi:nucleoside diphosphate kinase
MEKTVVLIKPDGLQRGLVGEIMHRFERKGFKFVVLMDTLHSQLKDLILFLNQYSKFNIYVAEIEYYKFETYEIMIPKLFGAEVKKDISVSKPRSEARVWDEESFFSELQKETDAETSEKMRQIYDFAVKHGPDAVEYGTNSFKLKAESKNGIRKTVFFANYALYNKPTTL